MNISHYFWEIKGESVLVVAAVTTANTQKEAQVKPFKFCSVFYLLVHKSPKFTDSTELQ